MVRAVVGSKWPAVRIPLPWPGRSLTRLTCGRRAADSLGVPVGADQRWCLALLSVICAQSAGREGTSRVDNLLAPS